jgi:hypothetical protein
LWPILQLKTLLEEKTVIVEHGGSQPCFTAEDLSKNLDKPFTLEANFESWANTRIKIFIFILSHSFHYNVLNLINLRSSFLPFCQLGQFGILMWF